MKNKKDIFDLFRDNEHKLDERPDAKLWDRLEGRLDQPVGQVGRRNGWRQWMSMAGVLLALIVVISAASLMLQRERGDNMRAEATAMMPLELEEIGIYSDKGSNYTVGEYQKILSRLNTSPILEGDPNKKIRIQKSVFASLSERSKKQIASVNKLLESEKGTSKNKSKPAGKILADKASTGSAADAYDRLNDSNTPTSSTSNETKANADEVDDELRAGEGVAAYNDVTEKDLKSEEPASSYGKSEAEDMALDNEVTETEAASMEETELSEISSLNVMKNDISVGAASTQAGLQQFEWLLGKWEAPANDQYVDAVVTTSSTKKAKRKTDAAGKEMKKEANVQGSRSVEEWKALDEFTIEGQGYLVVNGDTTFTESMQIKKIGNNLYYILALDNSGQTVQYKLKTYTQEAAVFENNAVAFPNQVILQQDMINTNFTTVLQNKAPAQINYEQQQYFQNRNAIKNEQVKRVLNRVQEK